VELATLRQWLEKLGWKILSEDEGTLKLARKDSGDAKPAPFFVQLGENWVLLSILPVFRHDELVPEDLARALLAANRDMKVAKFALGEDDEVVLCAELPTESLQIEELGDAAARMIDYKRHHRSTLLTTAP
jgi:hypothetical protein